MMTRSHPAWSTSFATDALQPIRPLSPIDNITRQWAWGQSSGRGVKVAVIDSDIDATHPAIDGNVAGYMGIKVGQDGLVYDSDVHTDAYGHGTACAGIIRTLAPDCELYSVKVLGASLYGSGNVFIAGLRWAIENGMDVCNMSLGTTKKEFFGVLHELVDLAYFRNIMLVTAANNLPIPSFPSVYASVISVAAHDIPDPYHFYYNPSPPIEFGAPGINVHVPWLSGTWMTVTGNSYATPHLSGIIAKILGEHPRLTPFQMKSILRALAANVTRESQLSRDGSESVEM